MLAALAQQGEPLAVAVAVAACRQQATLPRPRILRFPPRSPSLTLLLLLVELRSSAVSADVHLGSLHAATCGTERAEPKRGTPELCPGCPHGWRVHRLQGPLGGHESDSEAQAAATRQPADGSVREGTWVHWGQIGSLRHVKPVSTAQQGTAGQSRALKLKLRK